MKPVSGYLATPEAFVLTEGRAEYSDGRVEKAASETVADIVTPTEGRGKNDAKRETASAHRLCRTKLHLPL
mgnify:CR=1 FL=1